MVDWMVEVMTAFKCGQYAFFLAISLMDRYFKQVQRKLESKELHLTGVACMFIASKYEDIYPLLMKTVYNKIGHQKFSIESIEEKEIEVLRVLGFKVGSPHSLEFLDRVMEETGLKKCSDYDSIYKTAAYLCKL